MLRHFDSKVLV